MKLFSILLIPQILCDNTLVSDTDYDGVNPKVLKSDNQFSWLSDGNWVSDEVKNEMEATPLPKLQPRMLNDAITSIDQETESDLEKSYIEKIAQHPNFWKKVSKFLNKPKIQRPEFKDVDFEAIQNSPELQEEILKIYGRKRRETGVDLNISSSTSCDGNLNYSVDFESDTAFWIHDLKVGKCDKFNKAVTLKNQGTKKVTAVVRMLSCHTQIQSILGQDKVSDLNQPIWLEFYTKTLKNGPNSPNKQKFSANCNFKDEYTVHYTTKDGNSWQNVDSTLEFEFVEFTNDKFNVKKTTLGDVNGYYYFSLKNANGLNKDIFQVPESCSISSLNSDNSIILKRTFINMQNHKLQNTCQNGLWWNNRWNVWRMAVDARDFLGNECDLGNIKICCKIVVCPNYYDNECRKLVDENCGY